jgi:hypothetical protein
VTLGLETYDSIDAAIGARAAPRQRIILGLFVVELALAWAPSPTRQRLLPQRLERLRLRRDRRELRPGVRENATCCGSCGCCASCARSGCCPTCAC